MHARVLSLLPMLLPLGCGDDTTSGDGSSSSSTGSFESTGSGGVGTVDSTGPDGTDTGTGSPTTSTDGASTGEPGDDCVVHVDGARGRDAASGFSWPMAKQTLGVGLGLAQRYGCEVWVAAGTYRPSEQDPHESFVLFEGAQVYGGFTGDESSRDERDWEANPTVLSGDIGAPGSIDDNTLHVVVGADGAHLDGFEITGGYSRDPAQDLDGAGLWVEGGSMSVAHCSFTDNRTGDAPPPDGGGFGDTAGAGAGIGFIGQELLIDGCTFSGNVTGAGSEGMVVGGNGGPGAGVSFQGSSLTITGSGFTDNVTGDGALGGNVGGRGGQGGALCFFGGELRVEGTSFANNTTGTGGEGGDAGGGGGFGGALMVELGDIHLADTEFVGNTTGPGGSGAGGGAGGPGGAAYIERPGDTVIEHCRFEGNATGTDDGVGGPLVGAGSGGAIHTRIGTGDVLVAHSTFVGNAAGVPAVGLGSGGAIIVLPTNPGEPQGSFAVVGSVFAGNLAITGGGMVLMSKGAAPIDVVACAFGDNDGGAVSFRSFSPEGMAGSSLTGSILWGNPSLSGQEIETDPGLMGDPVVPLVVASSIVEGGCVDDTALSCGPGILDVDPVFADPGLGDLHPLGPAGIDQGDDTALPVDVLDLDGDGNLAEPWSLDLDEAPRVTGVAVDLGPYEAP